MGRLDQLSLSAPVEEVVSEEGTSHLRVVFVRPLGAGLRRIPIPRNLVEFLLAKRQLAELAAARGLARLLVHAAFTTIKGFPRCHTQLYLSDSELVSASDRFDDVAIAELARMVDAVASSVEAEVGRLPRAAWKQAVQDGWSPLVEQLDASFDLDALELVVRRGQRRVRVRVALDGEANWFTRVVVPLDERAARHASEVELDPGLETEALQAEVVGGALVLTRGGIVADAKYLSRLIDIAFEMAGDLSRHQGPYRT